MGPRQKRAVNLGAFLAMVMAILAVGAVILRAGAGLADIDENKNRIADHEGRLRSIETVVIKTHTNVEWIRDTMEKNYP